MKYLFFVSFCISFSVVAQKPFLPAYDLFRETDPLGNFPSEATTAYLFPNQQPRDTATLRQWLNTLEPIQRNFYFSAVAFRVYDIFDCEQLMGYLPQYEADFLNGLRALSFPPNDIACFSKVLKHLSSLKRSGAKYRPYLGCEIRFQSDSTTALLGRFARDNFARLFSTDLENGFEPKYSGILTKQEYLQQLTLHVKDGIPVLEEIRDTLGVLTMRTFFSSAGKDSCRQWLYKNGILRIQTNEKQKERWEAEYYDTGKLFKMDYRKDGHEDLDSMAIIVYHENRRKLYQYIRSSIGIPKGLGSFWSEKAWDDSGNIEYENGNGIVPTYELKDGKLFIQKRELKLDSSLFLPFTPLIHWEDTTRAFVDAVTKDYIRTHSWAGYPTSTETCIASLTASTKSRLDSFQQAVLSPVFEVICSIYGPWLQSDSLVLTQEIKKSMAKKDVHEKIIKALIISRFQGFVFGEETLNRIYQLENNDSIKQQSWYYPNKSDTKSTKYARSQWDILVFELQFLKQSATPEELIRWMCHPVGGLDYLYKESWRYDTIYPKQTQALLATQDSMERFWLPKLKKLQKKVWKKLSEEEKLQILALRQAYHEVVKNQRVEIQLVHFRLYRNQIPNRRAYFESLYDFIEAAYPNFRYMQTVVQRPAGLVSGELEALSDKIYAGLGKQKEDLQNIEKQIFAALKPCSSIWISPFAWYWKGQNESRLRALNFMLI